MESNAFRQQLLCVSRQTLVTGTDAFGPISSLSFSVAIFERKKKDRPIVMIGRETDLGLPRKLY